MSIFWASSGLLAFALAAASPAQEEAAPYINTWLVVGTFDNAGDNSGFNLDWIGEQDVRPADGAISGGRPWRYFDDRLFSRNYDDYQDLFSYFSVKQNESIRAKIAYAHVYIHSERACPARLRASADNAFKAWLNGEPIAASEDATPYRDAVDAPITLEPGWNRLLMKIANRESGRFGFYARITDAEGLRVPGLVCSSDGPAGPLRMDNRSMPEAGTGPLPPAYREWPYVAARAVDARLRQIDPMIHLNEPKLAIQASAFVLQAAGGAPPYRWQLTHGALPEGIALIEDGTLSGTPARDVRLGDYAFRVAVSDRDEARAEADLVLTVRERPNRWYEETRLVALIHHPESMPLDSFDAFADLMKRQGYGCGMVISYNNGEYKYRWPSVYEPDNPNGVLIGRYKAALEKAGIAFGMYIGNLNGPNHGGDNGAILLVEDAIRRYRPAAFWFDWAGWNGVSLDALFSMIRAYDPDTLIVMNGIPTVSNGDWDVVCLEGWGAWGERHWDLFPFDIWWPKRIALESWRLVADPAFEYSQGIHPDWGDYLRLQISLIGAGYVANIDHSPTIASGVGEDGRLPNLDASPILIAHRKMAEWANPPGLPPLYVSYTGVNPGPLAEAPWGYNTINLTRDTIYVHMLRNPYGKAGMPESGSVTVGPVQRKVLSVVCMNTGETATFEQQETMVTIDVRGIPEDPLDTIFAIALSAPHPDVPPPQPETGEAIPPGNLAWRKPSQLLSVDGLRYLPGSAFHVAPYGVDGLRQTFACGGNEWAWMYHVDLEAEHSINCVVLHFADGYPTEYRVLLSPDGETWQEVHRGAGSPKTRFEHRFAPSAARYIRVQCIKPDGPDQEGVQMTISEIEAYAAP